MGRHGSARRDALLLCAAASLRLSDAPMRVSVWPVESATGGKSDTPRLHVLTLWWDCGSVTRKNLQPMWLEDALWI